MAIAEYPATDRQFELVSPFGMMGDQPAAVGTIVDGLAGKSPLPNPQGRHG